MSAVGLGWVERGGTPVHLMIISVFSEAILNCLVPVFYLNLPEWDMPIIRWPVTVADEFGKYLK